VFVIEVDLKGIDALGQDLTLVQMELQEAIPAQLLLIQSTWVAAVSGHDFEGMKKRVDDPRYAAMIATPDCMEYPFNGSEFEGRVVAADGDLVKRYEEGFASYDMKPGLLAGPNAKMGEHGPYNTVPFTHSTPGSEGQKGAAMPQSVYAQAKGLAEGQRLHGMGDLGKQTKSPFQVNAQATVRGLAGPMKDSYTHKASPYEGMVKIHQQGHTTYKTFRRVSEGWVDAQGKRHGSDPNSWIHPGQAANPIMKSVADYCRPLIIAAFEAILAKH
jgi:hypothetical protein